jgi:serine protease Do
MLNKVSILAAAALTLVAVNGHALTPKQVFQKAGPAVVLILGSDDGKSGSAGTGSIVTSDGKVITNAHVVLNASNQPYKILYIFLKPAKITGDNTKDLTSRFKAKVLAASPAEELDLALMQIEDAPASLPTIAFGDPEAVEVGDSAVAIGHPEQGGLWTLTTGAVSSMISNFSRVNGKHVFQTEASVNRGNSGGPLLDEEGNMIGINTCIARQGAGGLTITDINFALKSSVAVTWLGGQGMGLAYAAPREEKVIVAAPPEPKVEPKVAQAATPGETVAQPPPATIVVKEKDPPTTVAEAQQKVAQVRQDSQTVGKGQAGEKLEEGKRLDPKTAKPPTYVTEKRPINLDDIRRQQMKELEDMMDEMRGKVREKRGNVGLW